MAVKRFAVLLCAEDSDYVKKMYGGYFKVFTELLREEGETWDVYRVAKGEFPRAEDVQSYDGFVITGSCHDAHGDEDWIHELIDLLKSLNSLKKKILGICFGHQILSRVLGGKIGRANKGWDIGVRCIHPLRSNTKMLSSLQLPSHLLVIEWRQDEVWELPPQAEVIARSDKTGTEMFGYGQHVLGFKGILSIVKISCWILLTGFFNVKQFRYHSWKPLADQQPGIKGQFVGQKVTKMSTI